MAQMLHFHCPACGTTLQLPAIMGGQQGPCPRCHQEIIAPNPTTGTGAKVRPIAPPPPAPPPVESFKPFSDSPPLAAHRTAAPQAKTVPILTKIAASTVSVPNTPLPRPAPVIVCSGPRRVILFLSCLLTAALCLAIGYVTGQRAPYLLNPKPVPRTPPPPATPPVVKTVIPPEQKLRVPEPSVDPTPVPMITENPPEPAAEIAAPKKISDQALATLKAFLDAPDWASRNAYVLHAEQIAPQMEAYSKEVADGPTPYTAIQVANSVTDSKTGETLFIFQVDTASMPDGIPVAVQETPKGWLVDWQSFVEFRDDRFVKFADGPAGTSASFHLLVRTPPQSEDQSKNEHFVTYLLAPPLPDRERPAFCRKNSAAHALLQETTPAGGFSNLILDVAKKTTPDGKTTYLEIIHVKATDWRPLSP